MVLIAIMIALYVVKFAVSQSNHDDLHQAVRKASFLHSLSTDKPIIIATAVNHGFMNHLLNFDCFLSRLGLKYVALSLDSFVLQDITAHYPHINTAYLNISDSILVPTNASEFRTRSFNIITARKVMSVIALMELNVDILFLDADVILLQNPFKYLLWKNVDYVHSLNYYCDSIGQHWNYYENNRIEGNTGFYFVRANNFTLSLFREVYSIITRSYRIDDQIIFWKHLRSLGHIVPLGQCSDQIEKKEGNKLTLCALNNCLFSSGMLISQKNIVMLKDNLKAMNETAYSIHANFIKKKEHKFDALQANDLWLFDEETKQCNPYRGNWR